MKTDAALSWKGLTLSAALHGTVVAAAGWVLLQPAQVGVQEAPVTAEFQLDSETFSSPSSVSAPKDPKLSETPPESSPEQSVSQNPPAEDIESCQTLPETDPAPDPLPAATASSPVLAKPEPPRSPVLHSVSRRPSHRTSVPNHGARNLQPDYLSNPPPLYPERSRLAGEQGVVLVRAEVSSSGEVSRVSLARSSGHPSLDRAAVEAVGRWRFRPASAAGMALASEVTVPVRFELHQGGGSRDANP